MNIGLITRNRGIGTHQACRWQYYPLLILFLALVGAFLTGALTFLHYYPETGEAIFCTGKFGSGCRAVNQSEYSTLFGVSLAAYGLFFYLLILFTTLIADHAKGPYYLYSIIVLAPLIILSQVVDLILAVLLITMGQFCLLCVLSYVVNVLLLVVFVLWCRQLRRESVISVWGVAKEMVMQPYEAYDKKAAAALYLLFVCLLGFAVFSTSSIFGLTTHSAVLSRSQIKEIVDGFYKKPVERLNLPESRLRLGNSHARVQIVAFTDFLCPACCEFLQTDIDLCTRYKDDVSVSYYNYPLDRSCNRHVQETRHESACTASKALIASASMNVLGDYLQRHAMHARSNKFKADYGTTSAVSLVSGLAE